MACFRAVDEGIFWGIVEDARRDVDSPIDEADAVAEELTGRLAGRSPADVLDFKVTQERLFARAYRWDLWAAAYVINGGCSDDGFEYFRGWLMAQGRRVWEAALADPDSLADVVDEQDPPLVECEEMLYVGPAAYEQAAGDGADFWAALERHDARTDTRSGEPEGEEFDFEDEIELRARLPRLAAAFLSED